MDPIYMIASYIRYGIENMSVLNEDKPKGKELKQAYKEDACEQIRKYVDELTLEQLDLVSEYIDSCFSICEEFSKNLQLFALLFSSESPKDHFIKHVLMDNVNFITKAGNSFEVLLDLLTETKDLIQRKKCENTDDQSISLKPTE